MVERFFRDISENRLRRGVFTSVPELVTAIDEYIAHHNTHPKPFIWTKSARDILQKVIRANSRLSFKQNEALHYQASARWLTYARSSPVTGSAKAIARASKRSGFANSFALSGPRSWWRLPVTGSRR
jgi:hypothetical protein